MPERDTTEAVEALPFEPCGWDAGWEAREPPRAGGGDRAAGAAEPLAETGPERASERPDDAVFRPDPAAVAASGLTAFRRWCEAETGRIFPDHAAFDRFCVAEYRTFWGLFLRWSGLPVEGAAEPVVVGEGVEDARFFPGLRLNYAECCLAGDPEAPALTARRADGRRERLSRGELRERVARLADSLARLGVRPGDRLAAIARNDAEAVVAALATAALGATFSSCGPDMGPPAVLARFAPLAPVVLFAPLRREPWDSGQPVPERVAEVAAGLPSLAAIVALDDGAWPDGLPGEYPGERPTGVGVPALHRLADLTRDGAPGGTSTPAAWERRPFDHPLFILFSSGTTGAPKCIVHGAGGTLLEHVKEHRLHGDLDGRDRLFFQTSCGWMMWNWQLSALACGAEIVLYDGPLEGPPTFWRVAAQERATVFGTNAAHLQFCEDAAPGFSPRRDLDLSHLRAVLSTGSILYPRQYDWARDHVGPPDGTVVPLHSISGGTDILGCFVLGNPNLPVHRGESPCRSLGLDVRALNPDADGIGELVCANPFPSRPLGFHGDAGGRFHDAYFAANPGYWTHGDRIEATPRGGWRLHGRSDDVLNVRGIRVGTAEIYRLLGDVEEIAEAMALEQALPGGPGGETGGSRLVLLVVLRAGAVLDAALERRVRAVLARGHSAALVPARIAAVAALPVTFSGKRSEAAAREAVNGRPVRNREALRNPECLEAIAAHPALRPPLVPEPGEGASGSGAQGDLLDDLRRVCERALGIAPIGPGDNLLELGADSLAIVTMLMALEAHAGGREVPLSALLGAPTLEGLAAYLSGAGAEAGAVREGSPRVRAVAPADAPEVCRLLAEGFPESGIPAAGWAHLLDHAWCAARGHGFVLALEGGAHDGEIVGFIGTIHARRVASGDRSGVTCNHSSWYVRPAYRGWGMSLLAAAMRDRAVTYTSLTPGPTARAAFEALRFAPLDAARLLIPPLVNAATLLRAPARIHFEPSVVRRHLDAGQARIFDDHAGYDVAQFVVSEGDAHAYVVAKRRIWRSRNRVLRRLLPRGVPCSEILHCSDPALLARHLERAKLALLRHQRALALVADARLFPVRPLGLARAHFTCFSSPLFAAAEIDKLYSEFVLLPL